MSEVLLLTAAMAGAIAIVVAIFMPERRPTQVELAVGEIAESAAGRVA